MKFLSFLCTKWMDNCEAMTSSPHSFAYSYRLVKKCFLKIRKTSKCHNFLIFQPIFIRFPLLCLKMFTLSSEIKLNLLWSSSLICPELGIKKNTPHLSRLGKNTLFSGKSHTHTHTHTHTHIHKPQQKHLTTTSRRTCFYEFVVREPQAI